MRGWRLESGWEVESEDMVSDFDQRLYREPSELSILSDLRLANFNLITLLLFDPLCFFFVPGDKMAAIQRRKTSATKKILNEMLVTIMLAVSVVLAR